MTIQLSDDMAEALAEQGDTPLRAIHPATHKAYFVISEARYEQLKPLFETDPIGRNKQRKLLEQVGRRANWDAAEMDVYDRYDEHRQSGGGAEYESESRRCRACYLIQPFSVRTLSLGIVSSYDGGLGC